MKRTLMLSAAIFAMASAATAADLDRVSDMSPKMPSKEEQTWASNLWAVMKTGSSNAVKGVLKGAHTWTAGGGGITNKAGASVRTVQLQSRHGDRVVARLRFRTNADALTYAANVDVRLPGQLTLVEVRGKQAVMFSIPGGLPDDGWTDADLARVKEMAAVRKVAWEGLPASSARDLLLITQGGEDLALRTVKTGPAHDGIVQAQKKTEALRNDDWGMEGEKVVTLGKALGLVQPALTAYMNTSGATSHAVLATGKGPIGDYLRMDELFNAIEALGHHGEPARTETPTRTGGPLTSAAEGLAGKVADPRPTITLKTVKVGDGPTVAVEKSETGRSYVPVERAAEPVGRSRWGVTRHEIVRVVRGGKVAYETATGETYDPAKHGTWTTLGTDWWN